MGVTHHAKLVVGWELDEDNLRALVRLAHPDDDPDDDELFNENVGIGIVIGSWHLVQAGHSYADDSVYYLSAYHDSTDTVALGALISGRSRIFKTGRRLADKIGIPSDRLMMVYALSFAY